MSAFEVRFFSRRQARVPPPSVQKESPSPQQRRRFNLTHPRPVISQCAVHMGEVCENNQKVDFSPTVPKRQVHRAQVDAVPGFGVTNQTMPKRQFVAGL